MLELHGLTRRYGSTLALDDLSFQVPPGTLFGFLGPNGAGKTTAMRIVMGVARADAGRVLWNGRPAGEEERRRFGYMPEARGLYPRMRAQEQIAYFAELRGVPRPRARASARAWLERLGLGDRRDARVEELSHGNQQRVQLAAALVGDPELLVLDEPFSGLDPIGVDAMTDVLRERVRAGVAVVFSSHQLDLVEDLCEAVAIVNRGRLVLCRRARRAAGSGPAAAGRVRRRGGARVGRRAPGSACRRRRRRRLGDARPGRRRRPAGRARRRPRAGPVTHFAFARAPLSELFRAAVDA